MLLDEFIRDNDIDDKALARMRHRLFVVGRFNQRRKGETNPEVWLFTNRPAADLSPKYKANFTDVKGLRYEAFVQCLAPALAETIEYEGQDPDTAIPKVLQKLPRGGDDAEGAAVVDVFNYLFQRAISSTPHESLSESRPSLPAELHKVGEKHAGVGIFWLIRRNLHIFSKFQPRTHEIVTAFSSLFDICSRENGLPSYADGGALPAGFPEKLIDFVYQEDSRQGFTTDGIDFNSRGWEEIQRDKAKAAMFCNVVNAFRDALLESKNDLYGAIRFRGQTLDYQARLAVADTPRAQGLKKDFNQAREAYNGLRQVLRSKALISMVLDWVLTSYYDLDEVKALGADARAADKDEAVERAVLDPERARLNKVAEPVRRPSLEEREKFSRELTANFERLLQALVAKGEVQEKNFAALPAEIQSLAKRIQEEHPERVKALAGITMPDEENDYRAGFIESSKVILLDILCPTLYQQPILSEDMLRDFFRSELTSTYLTAVFLANESKDAVRLIGKENLEFFQKKIDRKSQKISDSAEIQQRLLDDFFKLISSPEIQRRMTEGLEVLKEAQTVLENAPQGLSAGAISAVRPDPLLKKSRTLEKTELKAADVNESIRNLVQKEVVFEASRAATKSAEANSASGSGADKGGSANAGGASAEASSGSASQTSPPESQRLAPKSKIEEGVRSRVGDLVSKLLAEKKTIDVPEVVQQATDELIADDKFMGPVRKNVKAFEQALFLIYQRYNENPEKTNFRNRVERLTLINAMLLFRSELGLGTVSSNLYHMLVDLVQHLDQENPDPKKFIRDCSLTTYFDNVKLEDGGITNLRKTLEAQAYENLQETVDFVSELWGIKYLMDRVASDRQAEVVIVNATADEFVDWLSEDNLTGVTHEAKGRLRNGFLVNHLSHSDGLIQPGLVYLADCSFEKGTDGKSAFLRRLAGIDLSSGGHSMLLPPMCLSTGYLTSGDGWSQDGLRWAKAASDVPGPVIVVGPSAYLNDETDPFKTYLPAGYLFAAHFLARAQQGVIIRNVKSRSQGRFRVIGRGSASMDDSLESVIWPEEDNDNSSFAVDYYLYVVLTLLATAVNRGGVGAGKVDAADFYKNFHRPKLGQDNWMSSAVLDKAVVGSSALQFSMALELKAQLDLTAVDVAAEKIIEKSKTRRITDVGWFNLARQKAGMA